MKAKFLTDSDLAQLLGISIGRLRNKIVNGDALPPRLQIPGAKNRLWPADAVEEWLQQFLVKTDDTDYALSTPQRKRGRPTKRETIRNQLKGI